MTPGENEGEVIVRFKEAHSAKEIVLMSVCGVVVFLMRHRQDGECLPEQGVSMKHATIKHKHDEDPQCSDVVESVSLSNR
jgi:hypothetical protein